MKVYSLSTDDIFIYLSTRTIETMHTLYYDKNFLTAQGLINYLTQYHSDVTSIPMIILLDFDKIANECCSFLNEISKINPAIKSNINLYACSSFRPSKKMKDAIKNEVILDYFTKPLNEEKLQKIVN